MKDYFVYILILCSLTLKFKLETQNIFDKLSNLKKSSIFIEYPIFDKCITFQLFHEYS